MVEEVDVGGETSVEGQGGRELKSPSPTESEETSDDVVHCVCGSTVDEGFMIQVHTCRHYWYILFNAASIDTLFYLMHTSVYAILFNAHFQLCHSI